MPREKTREEKSDLVNSLRVSFGDGETEARERRKHGGTRSRAGLTPLPGRDPPCGCSQRTRRRLVPFSGMALQPSFVRAYSRVCEQEDSPELSRGDIETQI